MAAGVFRPDLLTGHFCSDVNGAGAFATNMIARSHDLREWTNSGLHWTTFDMLSFLSDGKTRSSGGI